MLERKFTEAEVANTQLIETNASLLEINEWLTNEYAVKDGRIESLNELLMQAHQDSEDREEQI